MSERERLPNRRRHEIVEFELDGIQFVAGIGRFSDRRIAEIFFHRAGKSGSGTERFAHDAAVLASIALQRGASVSEIRHSLVQLRDGSGAGPVGKLLDLVEASDG